MSGIIFMLFLTLLPSLLVTPLLALRNVSSLTIVVLMRRLLIFSLLGLLLLLIFSDNEGIDWYFGLAIIWGYVSALDKLQELDSNNNDLRKYRDEACRTSYLDYYRKSIQELSAN